MTIQKLETDSITAANTPDEPSAVQVTEDAVVELDGYPIINLKKHSFVIVRIAKGVEPEADKSELQAAVDAVAGLNEAYYELLKTGQMMVDGIPVLSPTCLIPFKAKAWLDLKERKLNGERAI